MQLESPLESPALGSGADTANVKAEYGVAITAREQAELIPVEGNSRPLEPHEIAGRTLATLISPGTELAAHFMGDTFPVVGGYAAVFQIEETGSDVRDFQFGDKRALGWICCETAGHGSLLPRRSLFSARRTCFCNKQ